MVGTNTVATPGTYGTSVTTLKLPFLEGVVAGTYVSGAGLAAGTKVDTAGLKGTERALTPATSGTVAVGEVLTFQTVTTKGTAAAPLTGDASFTDVAVSSVVVFTKTVAVATSAGGGAVLKLAAATTPGGLTVAPGMGVSGAGVAPGTTVKTIGGTGQVDLTLSVGSLGPVSAGTVLTFYSNVIKVSGTTTPASQTIVAGMAVIGGDVAAGTTVAVGGVSGNDITLSAPLSAHTDGVQAVATHGTQINSGGSGLTMASGVTVKKDDYVFGTGITPGTQVGSGGAGG